MCFVSTCAHLCKDLNTSYVKVQLILYIVNPQTKYYLNTSYVKVQ